MVYESQQGIGSNGAPLNTGTSERGQLGLSSVRPRTRSDLVNATFSRGFANDIVHQQQQLQQQQEQQQKQQVLKLPETIAHATVRSPTRAAAPQALCGRHAATVARGHAALRPDALKPLLVPVASLSEACRTPNSPGQPTALPGQTYSSRSWDASASSTPSGVQPHHDAARLLELQLITSAGPSPREHFFSDLNGIGHPVDTTQPRHIHASSGHASCSSLSPRSLQPGGSAATTRPPGRGLSPVAAGGDVRGIRCGASASSGGASTGPASPHPLSSPPPPPPLSLGSPGAHTAQLRSGTAVLSPSMAARGLRYLSVHLKEMRETRAAPSPPAQHDMEEPERLTWQRSHSDHLLSSPGHMGAIGSGGGGMADGVAGGLDGGNGGSGSRRDDGLNLWKGKRLNKMEQHVEQRLNVVRCNPEARVDLQNRVKTYREEKAEVHAERIAQGEFAAERREQKTCEFVAQRIRSIKGKAAAATAGSAIAQPMPAGIAALFSRTTGLPISDPNPLPEGAQAYWCGFVQVAVRLQALRNELVAKRVIEARQNSAATTVQRHWRGVLGRRMATDVRAEPAAGRGKPKEMMEDAATVVISFLCHQEKFHALGVFRGLLHNKHLLEGTEEWTARRQSNMELVRTMRVKLLMSQWRQVEAAAIAAVERRMQTDEALGVQPATATQLHSPMRVQMKQPKQDQQQQQQQQQQLASDSPRALGVSKPAHGRTPAMDCPSSPHRSKAGLQVDMQGLPADPMAALIVRQAEKCATTDRVLVEGLVPVPEPVKLAVLQVFMEERMTTYATLIGLWWKDRSYFKACEHRNAMDAMKRKLMDIARGHSDSDESEAEGDNGMAPEHGVANVALVPLADESSVLMEVGVENSASALMAGSNGGGAGGGDPTLSERVPARLPGAKRKRYRRPGNSNGRKDVGRLPRLRMFATLMEMKALMQQGVAEMPRFKEYVLRNKLTAFEGELADILEAKTSKGTKDDKQRSFTLTLLLHRWHTDAHPRMVACMRKRLTLGHVNHIEALACHPYQSPAVMAAEIMALRDG